MLLLEASRTVRTATAYDSRLENMCTTRVPYSYVCILHIFMCTSKKNDVLASELGIFSKTHRYKRFSVFSEPIGTYTLEFTYSSCQRVTNTHAHTHTHARTHTHT